MGMCGNEDFTLPKQIIAVEMTFADECRSSTTMQGFALVPIANRAGHGFVIDEWYRERWVCRLRCGASFRAGRLSRATGNVHEGRFIDVEVIGNLISPWLQTLDRQFDRQTCEHLRARCRRRICLRSRKPPKKRCDVARSAHKPASICHTQPSTLSVSRCRRVRRSSRVGQTIQCNAQSLARTSLHSHRSTLESTLPWPSQTHQNRRDHCSRCSSARRGSG